MDEPEVNELKKLSTRLQNNGFSWQLDDYFLLRRALPKLLELLRYDLDT